MRKIDALFALDNGYININSDMFILKANNKYFLQVGNIPHVLQGGKFEIIASDPESFRAAVIEKIQELYKKSLSDVIKDLQENF